MSSTKCIYVVGPSSTGKTTLCDALAKELCLDPAAYVTEVARRVLRQRGFTRDDVGLLEMQEAIMGAQLIRELEVIGKYPILLSDRSAVDPVVYGVLTAANREDAEKRKDMLTNSQMFQTALRRYQLSEFMLLMPVKEWLRDDGVRLLDDQDRCFAIFVRLLEELKIPYRTLGPEKMDLKERVSFVVESHALQVTNTESESVNEDNESNDLKVIS